MLKEWTPEHARRLGPDTAAACGYALVFLLPAPAGHGWTTAVALLTVAAPLPLRWLWPQQVFAVVLVGNAAALIAGVVRDPLVAAAFALYPLALEAPRGSPRRLPVRVASLWGVLLFAALATGGTGTAVPAEAVRTVLLGGIALGGAWILGRTVRDRRTQTARAVRESARRAATEERLNLARELHDVVSGTLNVIHVQASVARHLARERPEQAVETLRTIESASREGIAEMGRMLDILRNGDGSGDETRGRVPDDAPHDVPDGARHLPDGARHLPQRDTETLPNHLERIADAARAAGVDVSLVSEGLDGPGGAGAEVALTVRRVVREGLTNVVRHAAPTRCRIRVVADRGRVEVEIVDEGRVHGSGAETGRGASGDVPGAPDVSGARDGLDGRDGPGGRGLPGVPQPPETSGHGLPGMRERVTALGGGLTAGPVPGGGFRVRATVPLQPPRDAGAGRAPVVSAP